MTGSAPAPVWIVTLDANVLLQAPMRDILLRLAEAGLLGVFWSEAILAEVERNFATVTGGLRAQERWERLSGALARAFPDATMHDARRLVVTMPIDAHDRHVLACAVAAAASIIVTYNTRHFPAHLLVPYGVRAWHPDTLLSDILAQRPDELRAILSAQGAELHPPRSLEQVVARLARDAPRFADEARHRFGLN